MAKHKYIKTPEELWNHFEAYMVDAKSRPFVQKDWVGKDGDQVEREKERPLSFVGFEVYLYKQGIINDLGDYESNKDKRYQEYATILTRVKKFIEADQFEGASVGVYQQNIIARKLGLVEKTENKDTITQITVIRGDRNKAK